MNAFSHNISRLENYSFSLTFPFPFAVLLSITTLLSVVYLHEAHLWTVIFDVSHTICCDPPCTSRPSFVFPCTDNITTQCYLVSFDLMQACRSLRQAAVAITDPRSAGSACLWLPVPLQALFIQPDNISAVIKTHANSWQWPDDIRYTEGSYIHIIFGV